MTALMLICGMSGSGKSHTMNKLLELFPDRYCILPCYTTRPQRAGELSAELGGEYEFISEERFEEVKATEQMFQKYEPHGRHYGTTSMQLMTALESGKTPIRLIEPPSIDVFIEESQRLGYSACRVLVDVPFDISLRRMLDRFSNEMQNIDAFGPNPVLDEFVGRFNNLYNVEKGWPTLRRYDVTVSGNMDVEFAARMLDKKFREWTIEHANG